MRETKERFVNSYSIYALVRGLNFIIENDIRNLLKSDELTFPGFRILWILYFLPNIKMRDLTNLAHANISNIFRQLEKLEETGLVVVQAGDDARTKKTTLTEQGREVVQEFIEKNTSHSELQIVHIIDKISEEQLKNVLDVLFFLSNELIGSQYSKFIYKSSSDIKTTL